MADGALAITAAARQEFGDSLLRLMCWSHCHAAYSKKLKAVSLSRRKKIDDDIKQLQWSVQSQEELTVLLDLLVQKHVGEVQESEADTAAVTAFFDYFLGQYGPESHTSK